MKEVLKSDDLGFTNGTNVGDAIRAVRALHGMEAVAVEQDAPDRLALMAVPHGMRLVDMTADIDARQEGPRRVKGTEQAHTLQAFATLINRHKSVGTVVWANGATGARPTLTAVIDYHHASEGTSGPEPAWCEHRVKYEFPFTDSFSSWLGAKAFSQKEFLKFVRERARDIVDPVDLDLPEKGTLVRDTMLDVMRASGRGKQDREAKVPNDFYGDAASLVDVAKRMSSKTSCAVMEVDHGLGGITVTFQEEKRIDGVEEKAREYYLIEVEVFRGSTPATMPVRLKAEATDHGLVLGLQLVGVDRVIEAAFRDALDFVHKSTGVQVFEGTMG
jgi:uncharacterized protein YfdQ (DUF2303 family)